jgi:hypothetical protein
MNTLNLNDKVKIRDLLKGDMSLVEAGRCFEKSNSV